MIGEGALRRARSSSDVADAGAIVAGAEHGLQARVQDRLFEGWFWHVHIIRTYVLTVKRKL